MSNGGRSEETGEAGGDAIVSVRGREALSGPSRSHAVTAKFCGLLFLSRSPSRQESEDLFVYLLSFLTLEEASDPRARSPLSEAPHAARISCLLV